MRFIIGNVTTQVVIGGADNLLEVNLQQKLKDLLKVRAKGYARAFAYTSGKWDGYTRLLTGSNKFATGLLPVVIKMGKGYGAIIELIDERSNKVELLPTPERIGNKILGFERPYQIEVVNSTKQLQLEGLPFIRGIWDLATNSGKTIMITALMMSVKNLKCLYLVDRIKNFGDSTKWFKSVFDEVGVVAGKKLELDKSVVVAKAGTLVNKLSSTNVKKYLKQFNMVVVDEAHRAGNDTYKKILKNVDAYIRIMQSGTPLDIECPAKKISIIAQANKVIYKITNQQLIDMGVSLKPKVTILKNVVEGTRFDYVGAYEEVVVKSPVRLEHIANIITGANKNVLIAIRLKEHGKLLKQELDKIFKGQITIEYIHSGDEFKDDKIEDFTQGRVEVLIDTGILKESANIPIINTFINAAGGKSTVGLKQYYGRGSRMNSKDNVLQVFDFFDYDKYELTTTLSEHSRKRVKVWLAEGFEVVVDYSHNRYYTPLDI